MTRVDPQERKMIDDIDFRNMIMAVILTHYPKNPEKMDELMSPAYPKEVRTYGTADYPLFGFNGNPEYPLGKITLPIQASTRSIDVEFLVVKLPSPYNLFIGRTWLHTIQAVPSIYHPLLRFPTEYGIEQIWGSQKSAQACYLIATIKRPKEQEVNLIKVPDQESLEDIGKIPSEKTTKDLDQIEINGSLDKFFMIGTSLSEVDRRELVSFLLSNLDVFTWTSCEMPRVDPIMAQYCLNVDPKVKPIIQKSRQSAAEHASAVVGEVNKLLDAGAIHEVTYPTWLSNTMVIKKKNGSWRICVDFTDLNRACPKDCFPLPKIDQLMDATAHH
ncbi:uncharacterized protein LOC114274741 [Camellia sinensis]|uniref:uncharacterized protein LOC114274741 n=1 Tax=Camellia sinensis TaxID=4442 RepID=UPI001035E22A|nr:uncharacterized protein LOC114274741 [Camellia sinensis]